MCNFILLSQNYSCILCTGPNGTPIHPHISMLRCLNLHLQIYYYFLYPIISKIIHLFQHNKCMPMYSYVHNTQIYVIRFSPWVIFARAKFCQCTLIFGAQSCHSLRDVKIFWVCMSCWKGRQGVKIITIKILLPRILWWISIQTVASHCCFEWLWTSNSSCRCTVKE